MKYGLKGINNCYLVSLSNSSPGMSNFGHFFQQSCIAQGNKYFPPQINDFLCVCIRNIFKYNSSMIFITSFQHCCIVNQTEPQTAGRLVTKFWRVELQNFGIGKVTHMTGHGWSSTTHYSADKWDSGVSTSTERLLILPAQVAHYKSLTVLGHEVQLTTNLSTILAVSRLMLSAKPWRPWSTTLFSDIELYAHFISLRRAQQTHN